MSSLEKPLLGLFPNPLRADTARRQRSLYWLKFLARLGYASRGVVYLIIGIFALLAAFGAGEKKDTKGALESLLSQEFGTLLVWAVILGLVSYAAWRFTQALFDADRHGTDLKGLVIRASLLVSAFTYVTLALYALSLVGIPVGFDSDGQSGRFAAALNQLVGSAYAALILSGVFLGIALAHWWKALSRKYQRHIEADDAAMRFIDPVSIIGLSARGVVFAIFSALLFRRFLTAEGADKPGLKQALDYIHGLPYGWILLALVGIGLIAFALYSFAEARWRTIRIAHVF